MKTTIFQPGNVLLTTTKRNHHPSDYTSLTGINLRVLLVLDVCFRQVKTFPEEYWLISAIDESGQLIWEQIHTRDEYKWIKLDLT